MSSNVSVRLDDGLAERLRLRSRAAGESLSDFEAPVPVVVTPMVGRELGVN